MPKQAPVCHIPPTKSTPQPGPRQFGQVPPATDLPSAITAINQLIQIIQQLTNTGPSNGGGGTVSSGSGNYNERRRVTEVVRVYNPDDHSQYVDIQRTNLLEMTDTKGGRWTYIRG